MERVRLELRVLYDVPARDCRRILRVLPRPEWAGTDETLAILPAPSAQSEVLDRFGNRVLSLCHARIEREFCLSLLIETGAPLAPEPLERGALSQWKLPSRAVPFAPEFVAIGREMRALAGRERADALNALVFQSLAYRHETADAPRRAADVWEQKSGSCADFAHVLLGLARASGLPARYVAGFGPFPGALHAWVEVAFERAWHALDPTHGRSAGAGYLPVAKGRDFHDCAPHRGTFRGQGARLELECEWVDK